MKEQAITERTMTKAEFTFYYRLLRIANQNLFNIDNNRLGFGGSYLLLVGEMAQ